MIATHTSSGAAGTAGSITVGVPTGSAGAGASGGSATGGSASGSVPATKTAVSSPKASTSKPKPTTSAPQTSSTTVKVDPLAVDCGSLVSPNDVKRITGIAIPAATSRIKDVANSKTGSTGSTRCLYGVSGGDHKLSLRVTKYSSVAAAAKQVQVTVQAETELGAKASESTVGGQKAHVLLRDGGLIDLQYADWTLALAVPNGFLKGDQPAQLTQLAEVALARVLKSAN